MQIGIVLKRRWWYLQHGWIMITSSSKKDINSFGAGTLVELKWCVGSLCPTSNSQFIFKEMFFSLTRGSRGTTSTRRLVTCRRRASPEKCVVLSFENLLKYKMFHWILDWIYFKRFDYFRSIISPFLVSFFLQRNSSPCLWRPFKLDLPPKKSFQQSLLRRGHNSQNSSIHSTFFVWQFWVW